MKTITVANQKGGVGKTTTTMNVGVALAQAGNRVLLMDMDPQANLTSYLGVRPLEPPHENLGTLDEYFLSKKPLNTETLQRFIAKTSSGVDLVASDTALSGVEYYLFSRPDKEMILRQFIERIRDQYDFVLIDTPPSLNLLTLNALVASDYVLVPVQPEFFSLEGVVKIQKVIEDVKNRWNTSLSILGILSTQVTDRRKLTQEVIGALRQELGDLVFRQVIHDNAAVTESSGHARSVIEYRRSSIGAQDYLQLSQEILNRIQTPSEAK